METILSDNTFDNLGVLIAFFGMAAALLTQHHRPSRPVAALCTLLFFAGAFGCIHFANPSVLVTVTSVGGCMFGLAPMLVIAVGAPAEDEGRMTYAAYMAMTIVGGMVTAGVVAGLLMSGITA